MGGVADAIAHAARAQPEAPFLFYRNAKGHFRWWSFAQAAAFLDAGGWGEEELSVKGVVVEREAVELLGGFLKAAASGSGQVAEMSDRGPGAVRDIWISWRSLAEPAELALARWAVLAGAAILVEPSPSLHPELVAWTRPTVVSGSAAELLALADGLEAVAPRFLRRRWFRQRAQRLRLLVVSGQVVAADRTHVVARWRALSPEFSPQVVPLAIVSRRAADSLV